MTRRRFGAVAVVLAVLGALVGVLIIATVNVSTGVTIGSGPRGTVSFDTAQEMARGLERAGFHVAVVPTERSSTLIDALADPGNPIDVTFVSGDVSPSAYPGVDSLGTITREAVAFAALAGTTPPESLGQAVGLTFDLGPKGSLRTAFRENVLAEYGITPENSTFVYLPADAGYQQLLDAGVQIASLPWDDPRDWMSGAFAQGKLVLIPLREARTIAGSLPSTEAVEIPTGALSMAPPVPAVPTPTIAQLITVVALDDLSPAAVYAIARVLTEQFATGSVLNQPGEFPNFTDRQLPLNSYAMDYYASGTVPWQFEHLPPVVADAFVSLLVVGTAIVVFATLYSLVLPEAYSLWHGVLKPRSHERLINAMERQIAAGKELTVRQRRRLSEILEIQDAGRVLRQRADNLRSSLSEAIEPESESRPRS